MATVYWTGAIDGDVAKAGNYSSVDADPWVALAAVPVNGDIIADPTVLPASNAPSTGTSGVAVGNAPTWNIPGTNIGPDGTFYGQVTALAILGGSYKAAVTEVGNGIQGGDFAAAVSVSGSVTDGTFLSTSNLQVLAFGAIQGGTIQGKVTCGATTLYAATASEAAPASKVLAGNTNMGVAGALPVARVMSASGGNILVTDVRSDTVTGAAAGGTLDISADNPPTGTRFDPARI